MTQKGRYQKQQLIGSSERVDVFLGLNLAFGRKVAIRELRGGVKTSETERDAFYLEFDKLAKFDHPRLIRIEDVDRTRAWVIQEYMPESILDLSPEFQQTPQDAFHTLEQILEGLTFLHSQGVIHCNLKASNIRISEHSVKICDARCIPIGFPGSLPKPRGSNRYLAPEMINEEFGRVGPASDIYVAAIVMLEALAGNEFESLFKGYISGTPDREMGWVRWHNSPDALDPVHELLPALPESLAQILDGMLCKEVRGRYANAERLLSELRTRRKEILSSPATTPGDNASPPTNGEPLSAAPPKPANQDQAFMLIDRPNSPIYVRCLSGPASGSIFPLPMGDIIIGTDEKCNVRLSRDQYPTVLDRKIRISLGNVGWQIEDSNDYPVIVDSKKTFAASQIRSGSIFRLSALGPDFQFVVQGDHDGTWQDIASDLKLIKPDALDGPQRRAKKDGGNKRTRRSAARTALSAAATPNAPAAPLPPVAAKQKKVQSAEARPVRAGHPPAASTAEMRDHAAAPAPPVASRPTQPGIAGQENASFVDRFKNMDKNKRNNLILILSLPIVAILVILFVPQSESDEPAVEEPNTAVIEEHEASSAQTKDTPGDNSHPVTLPVSGQNEAESENEPANSETTANGADKQPPQSRD